MKSSTLTFLQTVLPSEGVKCAVIFRNGRVSQRFTTSLEELTKIIQVADGTGDTVYHGCAAFKSGENRKHINALGARSLWLDIDAGEGKQYADATAAAQAVSNFCRSANFPTPVYVGSGYGIHCYWPLTKILDPDEWQALSGGLRELCSRHGLDADQARTSDISSILRPVGTHNRKNGLERVVQWGGPVGPYEVEQLGGFPANFTRTVRAEKHAKSAPSGSRRPSLVADALTLYANETAFAAPVASRCAQVAQLVEAHGCVPEPVWYAALGVFSYCEDGAEYAHAASAGYDGYTFAETQDRLDRAKEFGPTTCAHFAKINPQGCEGCPFRGQITSPIQLGREKQGCSVDVSSVAGGREFAHDVPECGRLSALASNFYWRRNSLVQGRETKDGIETPDLVSKYPLYVRGVQTGEIATDNFSLHFILELPHEGTKEIILPAKTLFSTAGISEISGKGAIIHDGDLFKRYVREASDMWNAEQGLDKRYEQYGWKDDDSFLYGPMLYTPTDVLPMLGNDEIKLRNQWLTPARGGSLERWSRAANTLFTKGCESQSFALLSSFAAPLMRFHSSGEGGSIISLVNDQSGSGKTTALEAVASVWGREEGLKLTDDDTKISKGITLGTLGNLPCIYDELYNRDPEVIKNFVLMFTNGRDKMRGTREGELRHSKATWQTIMVLASNNSIVDILSSMDGTDAPAFRLLEFHTAIPQGITKKGDALKRELKANSGYAGDAYLRLLMQPEVLAYIKNTLPKITEQVWQKTHLRNEHRFWVRTIAATIAAGVIVNKLGILDFSPDRITGWVMEQVQERCGDELGGKRDAANMLSEFLNEHIGDMLVVPGAWKSMTKYMPLLLPKRQLLIRYEVAGGRLFIQETVLRKWLVSKGASIREFMSELGHKKVIVRPHRHVTLGAGTDYATGQVSAVEVDGDHPMVSGMLRSVEDELPKKTRADRVAEYRR